MSIEERNACLPQRLEKFTEHTVTDRDELERQLGAIRQNGYGFTLEEYEVGLAAVAAPIHNLDGSVVAAVSLSGPNFRINPDTIPAVAEQVVDAAGEISRRNGQPQPS